jgi:hypothetical protein
VHYTVEFRLWKFMNHQFLAKLSFVLTVAYFHWSWLSTDKRRSFYYESFNNIKEKCMFKTHCDFYLLEELDADFLMFIVCINNAV